MSSIVVPAEQLPAAVDAALTALTDAVDLFQSESLDGLDDHEMLAAFRELEAQRRPTPTHPNKPLRRRAVRTCLGPVIYTGAGSVE